MNSIFILTNQRSMLCPNPAKNKIKSVANLSAPTIPIQPAAACTRRQLYKNNNFYK